MFQFNGKTQQSDVDFVSERYGNPQIAIPAPCEKKGGLFTKINPHVSRFIIEGKYVSVFHVKPVYYHHQDGTWRPMDEIANSYGNHHIDLKEDWGDRMEIGYLQWLMKRMEIVNGKIGLEIPIKELVTVENKVLLEEGKNIFFTTSTFYPDPDPEVTSVDGYSGVYIASGTTFNGIRITSGSNSTGNSTASGIFIRADTNTDKFDANRRSFYLFDTSSLPDSDTIDSATIGFVSSSLVSGFGGNVSIVESNLISNTNVENADYQGNVSFTTRLASDIAVASITADSSTYNTFTFNNDGINNISKTGVSKFGVKSSWDVDNIEPTWSSATSDNVTFFTSESTGTTQDPKLVVVHSSPGIIIDVSDSVGTLESFLINMSASVSDTYSIIESVTTNRGLFTTITDTLGITETISTLKSTILNISDSIGLAELVNLTGAGVIQVSDAIGLTDAITTIRTMILSINDSIGITESISSAMSKLISVYDNISMSETISVLKGMFVSISDNIGLTDAYTALKGLFIGVNDSLGITETLTSVISKIISVTDSITLSSIFGSLPSMEYIRPKIIKIKEKLFPKLFK